MAHNHHHKSPGMHALSLVVCFLTAIGAINWGLAPFNYNLVTMIGSYAPSLVNPLYYIIGVAGVISLLFFFLKLSDADCKC